MFLNRLIERNQNLIEFSIKLHRDRMIDPNTWVFDLDAIYHNARILTNSARKYGLRTYVMTKQYARNPFITQIGLHGGLDSTVAVDIQCAKEMRRYNIPVGHLGHLNQVPMREVDWVLGIRPEVITVYSVEAAKRISDAAQRMGLVQDILMRPFKDSDIFFTGQEGGFPIESFLESAKKILEFPGVRIVGVTAFPCVSYNSKKADPVQATPNFYTIKEAADLLRGLGVEVTQINAPGNTASDTMPLLASMGATHVEPGHGLLGTTPNQAFREGIAEIPCYVLVSEVSHFYQDRAYAFGGGLFMDIFDPDFPYEALVGATPQAALNNRVRYIRKPVIIDYHAELYPASRCAIGDTVVFGFRSQIQMTRSYIALVAGLTKGNARLVGIFDSRCTMLDANYDPVDSRKVIKMIDEVLQEYN